MPVHVSVGAETVRHGTFIPFGVFRQAFCPVALAVCVYVVVRGFHATRPIAAHSFVHHVHELVLITRESAHYVLVLQPHYGRAIGLEEKRRVHRPAYVKIVIGQQEMFGQSRYAVQIQLYGCGVEQRQVPGIYNLTVVYNPDTGIGRIKPMRCLTVGHYKDTVNPRRVFLHRAERIFQFIILHIPALAARLLAPVTVFVRVTGFFLLPVRVIAVHPHIYQVYIHCNIYKYKKITGDLANQPVIALFTKLLSHHQNL